LGFFEQVRLHSRFPFCHLANTNNVKAKSSEGNIGTLKLINGCKSCLIFMVYAVKNADVIFVSS